MSAGRSGNSPAAAGLRASWGPLLPLALLLLLGRASANARAAAKQALLEELKSAPPGKDVFARLNKQQRAAWEWWDGHNLNDTVAAYSEVNVDLIVAVKLVGFDGDGINRVKVHESELLKYLRGLHMDLQTVALEPEIRRLAIRPRVHFRVTKAASSLTHKLAGILTSAVFESQRGSGRTSPTVYLPHTVVDNVLAAEEQALAARLGGKDTGSGSVSAATWTAHLSSSLHPALTLYVLNLEPPGGADYLYTYREEAAAVRGGNWSDFKSCPGSLYVSESLPYAWVDLGAAPQSYGPLRGGHGQVFPHSLPHAASYQPTTVNTAILPDLAALAASAVQHLAWPPLQHGTPRFDSPFAAHHSAKVNGGAPAFDFDVHVIHIHDTLSVPSRSVDLDHLQAELQRLMAGSGVTVGVHEAFLSFAMCDVCVNAFTNSLRVRTQRLEGSTVAAASGQILDRLVLHQAMKEYSEIVMAYAGVYETRRALPVFVFDLSRREEALLLDGVLNAAAFPDMVLAVASRSGPVRTRYSCGHMPRHMHTGDVTRSVLGALLQTAFGVAHSSLRYTPASGVGWNHLWSLGPTPFGPLSALATASSAQGGAALRNLALVEMDRHTGRIAAVLQGLLRTSNAKGSWKAALPSRELQGRVHARLNVAAFKLELAATALAHGHNADALRLSRMLAHEAHALERVALQLEKDLLHKYECKGGTVWTALLWPPAGSALAVGLAVWWRSRGARMRAEARYDKIY